MHTTRPGDIGAVEVVYPTEREARTFAANRSRDHRVLSASVTRFALGEFGTRSPVTWFVNGDEQPQVWDRNLYPADGEAVRRWSISGP